MAPRRAFDGRELSARIAEMRRTLAVAELSAIFAAAKVAIQVRTDSDTILNHLEVFARAVYGGTPESDLGEIGLILKLNIESWLATRRDDPRTPEQRRDDVRRRAERAQAVLGPNHHRVRNFWESHFLEEGRETERYREAVESFRASLARRGWPGRTDFRSSLSSQNFATMLRRSDDPAEVSEGEAITAANAAWRAENYGVAHPFTMVAEGNRLLNALSRVESAHDRDGRDGVDRPQVEEILRDAKRLTASRKLVLGVHHGGTVKALSYQARALRLLAQHERARALAEEARAYYMKHSSKTDTSLTGILGILEAEGHAVEACAAAENSAIARSVGSLVVAREEQERARALWQLVSSLLDDAEADVSRWASERVWLTRLDALRDRRDAQRSSLA